MTHAAYKAKLVQEKLKNTIYSICTLGDAVFLGMDGILFKYDATSTDVLAPKEVLKSMKGKVTQLIPFPGLHLIAAMSENLVQLVSVSPKLETKRDIKMSGCSAMAAKKYRGKYYIAIGTKQKKLTVLEYREDTQNFTIGAEIQVPIAPRVMAWNGNGVFIGYKKEYTFVNVTNSRFSELPNFSQCITSMPVTSEVLLIDKVGIAYNADTEPSRGIGIQWQTPPHTLGYSYPYVLGLSDRTIEVRAFPPLDKRDAVRDIACRDVMCDHPKLISIPNFVDMDAASRLKNHLRCNSISDDPEPTPQPLVYVTTEGNGIYVLEPIPFKDQIATLVENNRTDDYESALMLCNLLSPKDVTEKQMQHVHAMHAFNLFKQKMFPKAMTHFFLANIDPRVVIKMLGMLPTYVSQNWKLPVEYEKCLQEARVVALAEVQEKFKAVAQLRKWLKQSRQIAISSQADPLKLDMSDNGMLRASVDTAFLHCLLLTAEDDVETFLGTPNRCVLDDCERILRQESKWSNIVALYRSKGKDRAALDLLTGKTRSYNSVPDAIAYIKQLNGNDPTHKSLIMEYSTWVLRNTNYKEALEMFYSENSLPPITVLSHVKSTLPHDLEAHAAYTAKVLADPVLKLLPDCRMNTMHESLIGTYVQLLKQHEEAKRGKEAGDVGKALQRFLKSSDMYNVQTMKKLFDTPQFYKEMAIVHAKLEEHEEALRVLAFGLGNIKDCVTYCDEESLVLTPGQAAPQQPLKGKDQRYELHFMLFQLLLEPPSDNIEPKVEDALVLLKMHADKINCLKAIKMLPPHTKLHSISDWISKVLREASVQSRERKIYKNLCKSEHHQVSVQLVHKQRVKCTIQQNTVCAVCKTKIGNSVTAYYPNKVIVHKICATKQGGSLNVCPVTKRVFSPLDEFCE
eukprot:TRINITY_DN30502_c0_g1_i1.p1 TRINITY_DN30502_c0_g1~~TRINITY_DN30502_c0_g1_i1.p1  ORF type:complete len:923 (+),score=240.94 TRINITY_DN30502_c0_g1_i1:49-2769(+)